MTASSDKKVIATDDAFFSAVLVTLTGSITPSAIRSTNFPVEALLKKDK